MITKKVQPTTLETIDAGAEKLILLFKESFENNKMKIEVYKPEEKINLLRGKTLARALGARLPSVEDNLTALLCNPNNIVSKLAGSGSYWLDGYGSDLKIYFESGNPYTIEKKDLKDGINVTFDKKRRMFIKAYTDVQYYDPEMLIHVWGYANRPFQCSIDPNMDPEWCMQSKFKMFAVSGSKTNEAEVLVVVRPV